MWCDLTFLWLHSRTRVDPQGTLIIQRVAPEDAGNYTCRAANEVGADEETVTLYYAGTRDTLASSLFPVTCIYGTSRDFYSDGEAQTKVFAEEKSP